MADNFEPFETIDFKFQGETDKAQNICNQFAELSNFTDQIAVLCALTCGMANAFSLEPETFIAVMKDIICKNKEIFCADSKKGDGDGR